MVLARMKPAATGNLEDALQIADGLVCGLPVCLRMAKSRIALLPVLVAKATQAAKFLFVAGSVQETMAVSGVEGQDLVQKAVQKGFDGILVTTAGAALKFPLGRIDLGEERRPGLQEDKSTEFPAAKKGWAMWWPARWRTLSAQPQFTPLRQ